MSGWESNEVEHVFSTGRTMRIRKTLSMQWLVLRAIEDDDPELAGGLSEWFERGTLGDAEGEEVTPEQRRSRLQTAAVVERAVVEAMFIRPRVHWRREDMPVGVAEAPEGDAPYHLLAADLRDEELSEILELAFKGVADASRFREEPAGDERGAGGASVAKKPKPRARARAGKH